MAVLARSLRGSSIITNIYGALSREKCYPVVLASVRSPRWQQKRFMSNPLQGKTVRIGCASGFWGDSITAAPLLVSEGNIDYLVSDYLSEITMSLLTEAKRRTPTMGYAPDFILAVITPLIKKIKEKGIRLVSNAGGINPHECAKALIAAAKEKGVTDLKVAVVTGDDLMGDIEQIRQTGIKEMTSGQDFPGSVVSMNAYIGALPIARALELGADVVVTGRCVDSALALGPLIYEFGWKPNDYDLLASGSLVGHLIECGAQCTGGIFTDWQTVHNWDIIGYPIAECAADGKFIISKPPKTGGLVSPATVAEQLVYELGDPAQYILPDVTCDFTQVRLQGLIGYDGGAVLVQGAGGKPASDSYKVCATYTDGFRATAVCPVGGPFASLKAKKTGEALLKRTRRMFEQLKLGDYTRTHIQVLGSEETYGKHAFPGIMTANPREAVLWLAVHHQQKKAVELFALEVASAGTSMAPGLTAIVGGRPRASPLLRLYSFLYPKDKVKVDIFMNGEHVETVSPSVQDEPETERDRELPSHDAMPKIRMLKGRCTFPLSSLALTRSGDKGNNVNIGVIARHPSYVPFIRAALTEESVEKYFRHLFPTPPEEVHCKVKRYELPGINAFNFVLENALGGGGVASLRSDPQGKALGQMLLDFKIKNVPDILPSVIEPSL
ncbi:uncharacterized protein LOC111341614 [Stylophora pistillata]|uniref:Uncharacterized protein n=1 Tax=Stylophora pistillata TaxID=50429 RepID=A0A2B4RKS2_STYPI|nr:uncharacterized protein LOC111341614 [Stylophora pistillata]PFX16875.1 hypothetical protein AWC38_SpisGene18829 [Stylophora pistillata]